MRLCEYDYEDTHMIMGTASQYCLRWNNHQTNLLSAFDLLLRQGAFTDVTLACEDGETLHAHRLVLASCSSYFSSLLTSTSSSQHPIIILKDVRVLEMRALLHYMYRGEVNVEHSRLKDLLKVAEGLRVKGLVEDLVSTTQTHPLPLVTTNNAQHAPSIVSPKVSTPEVKTSSGINNTPVTSPSKENWVADSVPNWRPFQPLYISPYKCPKSDSNSNLLADVPSSRHCLPSYTSPNTLSNNNPPRLTQSLDDSREKFFRDMYEKEIREKSHQSPSSDEHMGRRPASLPFPHPIMPSPITSSELFSSKASKIADEQLLPTTPILRTALAHTRHFHPDVSTIASLANSMLPLPPLLSAQTHSLATQEELRRAKDSHREMLESSYKNHILPKLEPLSDEDSKQYYDIEKDEEAQERVHNGALHPEISSYNLDPANQSQFSSFVSYIPTPKPEWKRYKQYTKADLMTAIEAVKKGMTALQASRKYKVPSRTLYDKIKKMGINTIPRRIPNKRPSTTNIETSDPQSLLLRHSSYLFPEMKPPSSDSDGFIERSILRDSYNSFQTNNSLSLRNDKKEKRDHSSLEGSDRILDSNIVETSTRASFSLLGPNMFSGDNLVPLDLTDTDSVIPTRPQIQERA